MLTEIFEELYNFNPHISLLFKLSLFSIIIIFAIVPISFLFNLVNGSINQSYLKIDSYFKSVQTQLLDNIYEIRKKFKSFFSDLIKNNQIVSEDKLITQKINTQNITDNLNQISAELSVIPGIVTNKDKKSQNNMNQYKDELTRLSKLQLSKLDLDVPEIKLDLSNEKKAKTAFLIFVITLPILIFAIILNTSLLNQVFGVLDLKGGNLLRTDFFGILSKQYSLTTATLFSFGFSLAEASFGFFLGLITFNKDKHLSGTSEKEFNEKFIKFLWIAPFICMFVEATAYFVLSFYQIRNSLEFDTFNELFESELLNFVHYSRMLILPAIGIAIVAALFGCGHFVIHSLLTFRQPLESKRIKKDIDEQRNKVELINENLQSISKNINNLAESIKKIQIQKIASEPVSKTFNNLSNKIKEIFELTNKEIIKVKKNMKEFVDGNVKSKISPETVKMQIFSNFKNILILLIGIITLYFTFPKKLFIPGLETLEPIIIIFISLLTAFLLIAFGNQLAIKKRLIVREANEETIYDPNTLVAKIISFTSITLITGFHLFLHLKFSESNLIGLTLSLSSCSGFLYIGYNLLQTMPALTLFLYGFYSGIKILFNVIFGIISFFISKVLNLIKGCLEVGSYPSNKIILMFRKN